MKGYFAITLFPSRRNASKKAVRPARGRAGLLGSRTIARELLAGPNIIPVLHGTHRRQQMAWPLSDKFDPGRFPSSDGFSRRLLLERHGHRRVRREANPLPLDLGDQTEV